jgi:hypothetical protein
MKYITQISLIITALVFSACSKEETKENPPVKPEITTVTDTKETVKIQKGTPAADAQEINVSDLLNTIEEPTLEITPITPITPVTPNISEPEEEISLESLGLI